MYLCSTRNKAALLLLLLLLRGRSFILHLIINTNNAGSTQLSDKVSFVFVHLHYTTPPSLHCCLPKPPLPIPECCAYNNKLPLLSFVLRFYDKRSDVPHRPASTSASTYHSAHTVSVKMVFRMVSLSLDCFVAEGPFSYCKIMPSIIFKTKALNL
ncbi:hypothetical protein QBC45DRAFT_246150 [Copromyces sp. CBS 386.78]|nr:hypothetical protein QBC45DRAFT_246150 [Copromyces sp. CBS 386.78]